MSMKNGIDFNDKENENSDEHDEGDEDTREGKDSDEHDEGDEM